jgi:hypothetical protein
VEASGKPNQTKTPTRSRSKRNTPKEGESGKENEDGTGGGIKESNRAGEYDQSTLYICTEIHDEIIMYNLIYASENYVSEMPKEPQQICILAI